MVRTNKIKGTEKLRVQLIKVLDELYHLEDLNNYRNNSIGKAIDLLQRVEIIDEVL